MFGAMLSVGRRLAATSSRSSFATMTSDRAGRAKLYVAGVSTANAVHRFAWATALQYGGHNYFVAHPSDLANVPRVDGLPLQLCASAAALHSLYEATPARLEHVDVFVTHPDVARFGNNQLRYDMLLGPENTETRIWAAAMAMSVYWLNNRGVTTKFFVQSATAGAEAHMRQLYALASEARHVDEFPWI